MVDFSAIARWPDVPACYGWLSLDRRGDWRLQGERVTHRGLIDFMNRRYTVDDRGCWFVQNGPQRVFVTLAYTPWVFRLDGNALIAHTGQSAGPVTAVLIDDHGGLLLETSLGIGTLDDRDLQHVIDELLGPDGRPATEAALQAGLAGEPGQLFWRGHALGTIAAVHVKKRFKFIAQPTA